MANNGIIKSYQDYKNLSKEQKELWTFQQLQKLDGLDRRFAQKRVEKIVYGFVGLILVAFAYGIINIVIANGQT